MKRDPIYLKTDIPLISIDRLVSWWWHQNAHDIDFDHVFEENQKRFIYEYNPIEKLICSFEMNSIIDFYVIAEIQQLNKQINWDFKFEIICASNKISSLKKKTYNLTKEQIDELETNSFESTIVSINKSIKWKNILEIFNAEGILITKKIMFDHEIMIILGKLENQNSLVNGDIDCFLTPDVRFIQCLLNLFEIGYKTGRTDEAIHNYFDAIENNDSKELLDSAIRLLNTQDFIRKTRLDLEKKQKLQMARSKIKYNPLFFNQSFFDDVMSNYIKATLWTKEKNKRKNKTINLWLTSLCEIFPCFGNRQNNLEDLSKNINYNNIKERCEAGEYGFYIKKEKSEKIWITLGPNCKGTMNELRNLYQFLGAYIKTSANLFIHQANDIKEKQIEYNQELSKQYFKSATNLTRYLNNEGSN